MNIGIGASVLAANRQAGRSDGITTYSAALLGALEREFPEYQFPQACFDLAASPIRHPLRRYEASTLASLTTGYRWSSRSLFGQRLDLFHALDHYVPSLDIPVVATIHDAMPLARPEFYGHSLRGIKNFVFRQKCYFADEIITVSEFSAEEVRRYIGIDSSRIHVVYEGVAECILHEAERPLDPETLAKRFNLVPGYVAFCGTISKKKNLLRLMDAFLCLPKKMQQAHPLVLIGGEYAGGMGGETVSRVRELQKHGLVRWLGRLSDEDMAQVVHHAALFAFPSLHEGFGLPVVDAFHLGIPVVTSNVTALPEIAGGAAVLVDPLDTEDIARGLHSLLSDELARAEFSRLGKQRSIFFSWRQCARNTFDVYRRLI